MRFAEISLKEEGAMEKPGRLFCLIVLGIFLYLLPSTGEAVNCPTDSLQAAIDAAAPWATITVTGTCSEGVFIGPGKHAITLDGGGTATINYPLTDGPTIGVAATWVTIKGFTIKGGANGIMVGFGGTAEIDSNTIENTGGCGILLSENGSAHIINNTIKDNPSTGITVNSDSSANIGSGFFGVGPNTIQNNGSHGIMLTRSSSASIVGNTISNNQGNGIKIQGSSVATIDGNDISGNSHSGIFATDNSGVIIRDVNTTTVNNGAFGVGCSMGAYVEGVLGTLNGVNGPIDAIDIGIKTSSLSDVTGDYGIDVVTASNGVIRLGNAVANNTTKAARMVVRHYDNSQLPVYLFGSASTSTDNFVAFGGGADIGNAATQLDLFTAPNTTTPIGTPRLTIIGNGNVGIGTQTPAYPLHMASGAHVTAGGVWTDASSREYKDNIEALTTEQAFDTLKELNPVKFAYKTDRTEKHVGFIAEDVPDLVATKDRKGLSPMDIVAVLTKVVQEQQKTNQEQQSVIKTLTEKLAQLEAKMEDLQTKAIPLSILSQK